MKKNLNVIQIHGIRGLIVAALIACCLAAGFIAFPGWVWMHIWNYVSEYASSMPQIGLVQGVLLWGIMIAAYFTFRKNRVVVCFKSQEGLDEDELKAVLANIKKQSESDPVLKSMLKAREAEMKAKIIGQINEQGETQDTDENTVTSDANKI